MEGGATRDIGGTIERIAILTTRLHPGAGYLARRLKDSGAEIAIINQRRLPVEPDSAAYFKRLWAKRGPFVAIDCFLLLVLKTTVAIAGSFVARARPRDVNEDAQAPCLRADPDIVREPWLRYVEVDNVNQEADRERLRALRPDLILLAGAPILSGRTIQTARVACINPHCGITPDYAGSSPYDWPLVDGRYDDIGYTVHLVVPKVDSGPVIWQERVAWDPTRPLRHLSPILNQLMYDRLVEIVLEMRAGRRMTVTPQRVETVRPPAGLLTRLWAEFRRTRYAARRRRSRASA